MVGSSGRRVRKTAQKSLGKQKMSRTGLRRAASPVTKKNRSSKRRRLPVHEKRRTSA